MFVGFGAMLEHVWRPDRKLWARYEHPTISHLWAIHVQLITYDCGGGYCYSLPEQHIDESLHGITELKAVYPL